jgi:hypothetical protein
MLFQTQTTQSAKEYAPGQVNQDLQQQDPTTQEQGATQQDPQDPTTLTDLELKEMNTLTALDEPTEEQKKRLSELQQRLPKNPAKLRSKQRT